jgi:hypothetical protein
VDIPSEIPAYNKDGYTLIGIGSSMDANTGVTKSWSKIFTKSTSVWNRLKPYDKLPKVMCNCHQMAILHNPTLKEEPVFVPFVGKGRLTDAKKEVLKEMLENGKGQDDDGLNAIAEQLNVSFAKVKEYIQSF